MSQDIFVLVEDDEAPYPILVKQEGFEAAITDIPCMRRLTFDDLLPLNGWQIGWLQPKSKQFAGSAEKET